MNSQMELKPEDILWDVAIIGGGPAGMMAAGRAAELGAKVILIEKNDTLGKKLLITGGGRCNITNAEFDTRALLAKFKDNDKFLFSAFSQWAVKETLDFFHMRHLDTHEEAEKRVFPITNKAQSVWDVLVENMKKYTVTVLSKSPVTDIIRDPENKNTIKAVVVKNKKEIKAKKFIIATGGKSRPETGSTGDGYAWMKDIGHTVIESGAALVPLALKDSWVEKVAGVSMQNIKISIFQNAVKQDTRMGKILFTHVGVSGPTILNMSSDVSELLKYGDVTLELDTLPSYDYGMLNTKLQEVFKEHSNKKIKNSLSSLIPTALFTVILELSKINPDTFCNSVTREERLNLVKILKHIPLHVKNLLGLEKAVITSGGVDLKEVDFKTMQSRLFSNLYIIGDMLNIDRPSGGYSLQMCWTTGFVAGTHAATS